MTAAKPTLILAPGLMCDATSWGAVPSGLPDWDCKVVDHGQADSLVQMAEQLLAGAPARFALAGHSMGGRVALEVMRIAPERVTHLGLFDTGHLPKPAGEAGDEEVRKRMALLAIARSQGVRAMASEWVKGMVAPQRLNDRTLIDAILDMFERKDAGIFEKQLHALIHRPDATAVLQTVKVPTLVLCGALDAWSPPAQHQTIADCIPARPAIVSVPDGGHMVMQEQPEAVLAAMRQWLALPSSVSQGATC
jgi:pimeloyl-ACP methyl ester carboxylesterase